MIFNLPWEIIVKKKSNYDHEFEKKNYEVKYINSKEIRKIKKCFENVTR